MDVSHFLFRVVDRGVHRGQRGIKIVLADVAFGAFRENHGLALGSSSGPRVNCVLKQCFSISSL